MIQPETLHARFCIFLQQSMSSGMFKRRKKNPKEIGNGIRYHHRYNVRG